MLADEASALGGFAERGGFAEGLAAPPGNGASSETMEENANPIAFTGLGNSSGGGMPLLIAPSATTSGSYSALVFGLVPPSSADGFKDPANYAQINDLDSMFIELWDEDQLLFPDALPPLDELLFPQGMPKLDDMPSPYEPPVGDDAFLHFGRRSQSPIAAPPVAGIEHAPVFAAPTTAVVDSIGIPSLILVPSPALPASAVTTGDARHLVPISQPVPANDRLEGVSAAPASAEEAAEGENLRPYHIALGMIPCLAAFGYTPASLREHVRTGQRAWKRLREYVRRNGSGPKRKRGQTFFSSL